MTIVLLGITISYIEAATVTVDKDNISYTVDTEAQTAEVYGLVSSSTTITNLFIPDFIEYDGSQIPVISIKGYAFSSKKNLRGSLTIGNNVQTIGEMAFYNCSGFTGSLTIGDNVQTIGESAFNDCSGFTGSLTIPDNVQTIEDSAFYYCSGFNGSLTIGDNVQTIGELAFSFCSGFTGSLTIGDNMQTIGEYAFQNCRGFHGSLTIPNSVQTIGDGAFYNCSGFTGSLTIGDNVQTIGNSAFSNCTGFTGSLTIGNNVETIGNDAFSSCTGFTGSLTIGNNVQTIGNSAFSNCTGFTGSLIIPENVQSIGNSAFFYCSGFNGNLIIGKNVKRIERFAFENCNGLTGKLILPFGLEYIGGAAFEYCSNLTEIMIPESVKYIGSRSFGYCKNIEGIISIPEGVEIIYSSAFYNCMKLKGLIISSTVKEIGVHKDLDDVSMGNNDAGYSFAKCESLEYIICNAVNPPKSYYETNFLYTLVNNSTLRNKIYDNVPLYVPAESVTLYKNATEWKKFKYINPIPVEATEISLNKTELNLLVGQEETLIATLTPEDATTEIVWSTENNDNVISVDQTGKVSALSVGTATVVVKAGEVSAICKITVKPVLATNIIIDGDGINTLKETETLQLTASILPDNVTYDEVTWSSSDENNAEVSQNGLVTALEAGQVEITAGLKYQPEIKAVYQLTIEPRILGDANDNGVVNVADVGTISDYIVNKQVFKFCFVNADVITDQRITTADVTATVDIIFNDDPPLMKLSSARKITATNDNRLVVDNFNSNSTSNIGIRLTNPSDFVGLQASVIIPQGMVVRNVISGESSQNHILNYNITDYGTLDFILYSLTNDSFSNAGSLLEIEAVCENSCEDINVENILASDGSANEYTLTFTGGKNNGLETSLESIEQNNLFIYVLPEGIMILNAKGENVNIFNLTGEVISSKEIPSDKEFYPLASGIYIVSVKDVTTKVIVK